MSVDGYVIVSVESVESFMFFLVAVVVVVAAVAAATQAPLFIAYHDLYDSGLLMSRDYGRQHQTMLPLGLALLEGQSYFSSLS